VREWQLDRSSLTGLQVGTVCVVAVWALRGYCSSLGTVWCGGEQASGEPGGLDERRRPRLQKFKLHRRRHAVVWARRRGAAAPPYGPM
jgi:hypothetical protein